MSIALIYLFVLWPSINDTRKQSCAYLWLYARQELSQKTHGEVLGGNIVTTAFPGNGEKVEK